MYANVCEAMRNIEVEAGGAHLTACVSRLGSTTRRLQRRDVMCDADPRDYNCEATSPTTKIPEVETWNARTP